MSLIDAELRYDCRDAYVDAVLAAAEKDDRVVAVVNDSVGSSKLAPFAAKHPDRLVNVGIAEQAMVGVAAGLADGGRVPFVSAASSFLTARALEQIKVDVGYSNHNVKLFAMSPGMAYGNLGPTHHSIEDVAWLRTIPRLSIMVPSDPEETRQAITWALEHEGPVFVRVSRMAVPAVNPEGYRFRPGTAVELCGGTDVTILANGTVVWRALAAADRLAATGVSARVLSVPSIKPFDDEGVLRAAAETGAIVTVEEGSMTGGLGGLVAELLVEHHPVPLRRVGVPDVFVPTGSAKWLMDYYGISADGISAAALEAISRK